jgi:hypothetical protein
MNVFVFIHQEKVLAFEIPMRDASVMAVLHGIQKNQ